MYLNCFLVYTQEFKDTINIIESPEKYFKIHKYELGDVYNKINNVINNLETSIPARASRGSFYFKLFEAQKLAIGLMNEAREMKALKYDLARENFQKAFNILEKALKEFFGAPSLQEYLVKRDKESSRNRKIDFIIYFILGIITGVIATLITRCIIK